MKKNIRAFLAILSISLSACTSNEVAEEVLESAKSAGEKTDLVIYSPAPPQIMLHEHNIAAAELLRDCRNLGKVEAPAVALPKSINDIVQMSRDEKPYHLPIVTTLDFKTAINDTAPEWHGYSQKNPDLKFVGSLYEVAYGIMVFDDDIQNPNDLKGKRIGVPARPSAVRWFTETLLEEGWGILDEVILVSLIPPEVPAALRNGEIDAVAWNIMSQTPEGYRPLLPMLIGQKNAQWINVDTQTVEKINSASPFVTAMVTIEPGALLAGEHSNSRSLSLLSFKQALAAWENTPDEVVGDIVQCLMGGERSFGKGGDYALEQFDWPGLEDKDIHSGARQTY